jgi:hypothetical protein
MEFCSLEKAGVAVEEVRSRYQVGIDEAYAMGTDLFRPLLFAPIP